MFIYCASICLLASKRFTFFRSRKNTAMSQVKDSLSSHPSIQPFLKLSALGWRVRSTHCDYSKLDAKGQEFSSIARSFSSMAPKIARGSLLVVLSLGDGRGILGLWQVIETPYQEETKRLESYGEEAKKMRESDQWRVKCKLLVQSTKNNRAWVNEQRSLKSFCDRTTPTLLSPEDLLLCLNILDRAHSALV